MGQKANKGKTKSENMQKKKHIMKNNILLQTWTHKNFNISCTLDPANKYFLFFPMPFVFSLVFLKVSLAWEVKFHNLLDSLALKKNKVRPLSRSEFMKNLFYTINVPAAFIQLFSQTNGFHPSQGCCYLKLSCASV